MELFLPFYHLRKVWRRVFLFHLRLLQFIHSQLDSMQQYFLVLDYVSNNARSCVDKYKSWNSFRLVYICLSVIPISSCNSKVQAFHSVTLVLYTL